MFRAFDVTKIDNLFLEKMIILRRGQLISIRRGFTFRRDDEFLVRVGNIYQRG